MLPFYFTSGYRKFSSYWWKHYLRPKIWYRPFIWAYQRATRGFADCDTWGLDGYLSQVIPKAIAHLRDTNQGYPYGLTDEEWIELQNKMIEGFEAAQALLNDGWHDTEDFISYPEGETEEFLGHIRPKTIYDWESIKNWEKAKKAKFEEGMKIFTERFFNLWD